VCWISTNNKKEKKRLEVRATKKHLAFRAHQKLPSTFFFRSFFLSPPFPLNGNDRVEQPISVKAKAPRGVILDFRLVRLSPAIPLHARTSTKSEIVLCAVVKNSVFLLTGLSGSRITEQTQKKIRP
jgi:hypothetical protein